MARSSGCGMNRFSSVASLLVVVAVLAGACAGAAEAGGVACHNQCPVDIKVSFSLVTALLSPVTCVVPAGATVVAKVDLLTLLNVLSIRIGAKVYVVPAQHYPALVGCVKLVVFPSGGPCGHGFITVAAFTKVDILDPVHAKLKVCLTV